MGPSERQHLPLSGRAMCLVVTVLVVVTVSSAAAGESAEATSGDFAPPIMNAHLAECYETLLRNTDRLCAEAAGQRNKVLTSALSKCLFGRVGLWKTEQCHHEASPDPKFEDFTDSYGSGSPECRQLKTYKSTSVYGTVLTSLLSACAMKESTQQMVEASVACTLANRSDSILPAKYMEELMRLTQRVDAVYSLVLEHSSWINMIFYYSGLATLLTIITRHPSNQHHRWQLFGIIVFTVIAEKFLCHIVLLVADVYSSKMVINLVQWTVRYSGLATTAIFFVRSFSLNVSLNRPSNTAVVPSAGGQEPDLFLADPGRWDSGSANESARNFVLVRVPETAVVSLVQLLRMFPNSAVFRDPTSGPPNPDAEQVAISAASPAIILAASPAIILAANPATLLGTNPATILAANPATVLDANPAKMFPVNPVAIAPSNSATTCAVNCIAKDGATTSATGDGATTSATEDGATTSATEDGATHSVIEDGATNSATEDGATHSATADGATHSATADGATNSATEDDGATLSDGSSDSSTPESPKNSLTYRTCDGYLMSHLCNTSFPDVSDEDDLDYEPSDENSPRGSSDDDDDGGGGGDDDDEGARDDAGCGVPTEEVDWLLSDLKADINEDGTAETMNLSYTLGTYVRGDRTILE